MSKRILITYFSHGGENLIDDQIIDLKGNGNTKRVAETLASKLAQRGIKANLFEIEPVIPYPTSYGETLARSKEEYENGSAPLINDGPNGFDAYDLVFLGYPNWWGTIPAPILSFLRDHNMENKTVIPFVTHGGQIFLYSLETIQREAPKAKFSEGFAVAAPYIEAAPYVIDEWLKEHEEILD